MKLVFIRHGEPDYRTDTLTEKGRREAELLAARVARMTDIEAVYVSPLGRARETAAIALKPLGIEPEVLPWLPEFRGRIADPGTGRERLPWDLPPRLYAEHPLMHGADTWADDPLIASGTAAACRRETDAAFDALLARHGYVRDGAVYRCPRNRRGSILFFCHFGIAMTMLSHLTDISPAALWQGFLMVPTSVTTLVSEERVPGEVRFRCLALGDMSHLEAGGEPWSSAGLFAEVYDGVDDTSARRWWEEK